MFDAVLFDLDGTLADTAPDLGGALNRLRIEQGLDGLPMEALRPVASNGVRGLLGVGFGIAPDHPRYPRLAERFLELYAGALCVHTTLFAGIGELLDGLDARGIHWGIVTNKQERYTLPLVERLGLTPRAGCVVSGDSTPRPKPHPDPLLLGSSLLGVDAARCAYVGDDLRDIQAGRAAGMATVAAGYGYLGSTEPLANWQADHLIDAPIELLRLLDGVR
jgi:2-phosphoglycolate phosphatase